MRVILKWPEPAPAAEILASRGHEIVAAPPCDIALIDGSRPEALHDCRTLALRAVVVVVLPAGRIDRAAEWLDAGAADVLFASADPAALALRLRAAEMLAEARASRRYTEEQFQLLVEAAFEGICVHSEGRVLYCNRAFAQTLGYAPEELVGAFALDRAAPEDRARIASHIATGYDLPYRAHGLRKDGSLVPVEIRGRTVTSNGRLLRVTAFHDLTVEEAAETERFRAEEALARSEARFRQLIEEAPDAVAVVGRDGRFLFANRRTAALVGVPRPEDLLTRSPAEFLTEDARLRFAVRTRALFEGSETPHPSEYGFQAPGGPAGIVEVVSIPIEFEGSPALLAFIRDVTERRRIEAQLRQSERMASLGLLAAGVAHEINNPLSWVSTNLEFAAARAGALPEIARAIGEARQGAARVAKIVRDLRVYTRAGEEPPRPVDVREPLRFALAVTAAELRPRARVVEDFTAVPPVLASEGRLGQVFVDLLTNAAHAIEEGAADANRIRVAVRAEGGQVLVDIEDTGRGIPAQHLPRLFEPFFTTKPEGQGTGLGLFVCHGIVRALGGDIRVESEAGRGTRVRILLPAAKGPIPAPPPPPSAPAPAGRRRRVLLIDDEMHMSLALARLLEPDHEVVAETEGGAALERLRAGEVFDVILCDLMMPRMTGMDLHAELSKSMPELAARMVFLTGGAFTPRSQAFLQTEGLKWLEKPFQLEDLLRAMEV
ncbi:MAG: PAS domain S-box protein [Planctomycetes bacterium]|nr:PAS domain S-box protein [Planctomycetota bacterium]